jgi:exodeoxyribonuclease V alpha subunit
VNVAAHASDIELTDLQIAALKAALTHPVSIITGGPGTGKTTILKILARVVGIDNIRACALAGRAAYRVHQATTIHRTIKMLPNVERFEDYDPDEFCVTTDFLVVDECSIIDTYLFQKLLDECSPLTRIILVGDVDQLGPIVPGQPFADMIASGLFPVTRLDRVFRFAEGGAIAEVARAINTGDVSKVIDGSSNCAEFEFVRCTEVLAAQGKICDLFTRHLPAAGIPECDIQILVPVHKGDCGRFELNTAIRRSFKRPDKTASVGDRVIQTKNDYKRGVFNGELGAVKCANDASLTVQFGEGGETREVAYGKRSFAKRLQGPTKQLDWGYTITVHNAQGSEFPTVIAPVFNSYSVMLLRNLFYTAVSRGRTKVIVIGEPDALQRAARNLRGTHRITKLAEFLNPDLDWPSRTPDMGAISYLELERKSEEEEAEEYLAAFRKEQERLIAKFEAGEATGEEIGWLIKVGVFVPANPAAETINL